MEIKRNQINIPSRYIQGLTEEFNVSRMTISNALRDITQSDLAKKIRTKAMEILEQELKGSKI